MPCWLIIPAVWPQLIISRWNTSPCCKYSPVLKKNKKKIRAAYQLVPQKLGLIRQTKHKIQGCSEVKNWHWINIFFLKKKKAIYMQMMLLAFAVIAICARHPKRYNGNTFKLRGGTGRKACGQWAEIWGSWVVFRYIALSSLVTQFSSS